MSTAPAGQLPEPPASLPEGLPSRSQASRERRSHEEASTLVLVPAGCNRIIRCG